VRDAAAQHRIREQPDAVHLDEHRGMADEPDAAVRAAAIFTHGVS
jgi:hypothetical protein